MTSANRLIPANIGKLGDRGWVTNNPEAAARLRAADDACDRAMRAASGLRLADKIDAIRSARAARDAAYRAVADA